ncbi:hypothetical protein [Acinetobacter sp. FDAARGOS_559]|nr:hypothetical protein [Acinetobacter sp. FDAARGOS_559]
MKFGSLPSHDMRAGMDTVMAQVVRAFGYIKPHCATCSVINVVIV